MYRPSGNRMFKSNFGPNGGNNPFELSASSILLNLREVGTAIKESSSEAAASILRENFPSGPQHSHNRSSSIDDLEQQPLHREEDEEDEKEEYTPPSAYSSASYNNSRSHSPAVSSFNKNELDGNISPTGPVQRSSALAGSPITPEKENYSGIIGDPANTPVLRGVAIIPLGPNGEPDPEDLKGLSKSFDLLESQRTAEKSWNFYGGFVLLLSMGTGLGMVMQQDILMRTGVYKFNYPIVLTVLQIFMTHCWFFISVFLSRMFQRPLKHFNLDFLVAPPTPQSRARRTGLGWGARGSIFEFEWRIAKQFLFVSFVFVVKVLFSNFSFSYADLPTYQISRILTLPLALIFTAFLQGRTPSATTISSVLTMTVCLFMASLKFGGAPAAEGIIFGIISSVFTALYPFMLLRSYNAMLKNLNGTSNSSSSAVVPLPEALSAVDKRRAAWRLLNYITILSFMFVAPLVLISGSALHVWQTCTFLGVHTFWFTLGVSGLLAFCVFASTLALVRCTSPLTTTAASAPREALQMVVLNHADLQISNWIGVSTCWVAGLWYLSSSERRTSKYDDDDFPRNSPKVI